jgi:hypothetical protein
MFRGAEMKIIEERFRIENGAVCIYKEVWKHEKDG